MRVRQRGRTLLATVHGRGRMVRSRLLAQKHYFTTTHWALSYKELHTRDGVDEQRAYQPR